VWSGNTPRTFALILRYAGRKRERDPLLLAEKSNGYNGNDGDTETVVFSDRLNDLSDQHRLD